MVYRAGRFFVWLYKKRNEYWKMETAYYWISRNEGEYAEMIIKKLEENSV